MKKLFSSAILVLSLLNFSTASSEVKPHVTMNITDTNGTSYEIKSTPLGLEIDKLKGKVIFLEFFGHSCPPCLMSIPHLIHLQEKHKDKLAIIAIEVQGYNNAETKEFAKKKGINYITVSEEKSQQFIQHISQRAQWQGSIPFLVAMDTNGNVQHVQAGMLPESALEELIQKLSKPSKK